MDSQSRQRTCSRPAPRHCRGCAGGRIHSALALLTGLHQRRDRLAPLLCERRSSTLDIRSTCSWRVNPLHPGTGNSVCRGCSPWRPVWCLFSSLSAVRRAGFFFTVRCCVALLAMIGALSAESLLLVAPWFLLPAAVAIGTTHTSLWRRAMAVSLAVVAGIGWYGVFARVYYATPRFTEPWGDLAVEAGSGGSPGRSGHWQRSVLLPLSDLRASRSAIHALAFCWQPSNPRAGPAGLGPGRLASCGPSARGRSVLWVAGTPRSTSMDEAGNWLDHNCGDRTTRYMARDSSYTWRQRFLNASAAISLADRSPPVLLRPKQHNLPALDSASSRACTLTHKRRRVR